MADAPDRPIAVLRDQERAVAGHRDANGAAPDLVVVDDEAGGEILVLAGRHAVLQADADDLVAGPLGAVPRSVRGRKCIAAIVRGKAGAVIEGEPQRRRMRLYQHIGHGDLALEVGPRAGMPRILMVADVEPWPAIERVFLYPRDIIGHEIVAEPVALVGGAPGRAVRLHRKPDAIA